MSIVLVYTAAAPGDAALTTAGDVAAWTARRLHAEGHDVLRVGGGDADRLDLELAIVPAHGFAAFAHGREEALLDGARRPVLDVDNVRLLAGRWAWMYACRTARDLSALALRAGASCFAGFDVPVIVAWEVALLPAPIQATFERLATEVPACLAAGCYDATSIRARLLPLVNQILDYYGDNPDAVGGFQITAQQMLTRLLVTTTVAEDA